MSKENPAPGDPPKFDPEVVVVLIGEGAIDPFASALIFDNSSGKSPNKL
ncbi:MAG: Uncharacterised protein [Flavobacteriales bacterium UBA4585]|nr:MAG: Uncharacterised protein [Flavobacteriales bacterium UBA4585]